MAIRRTESVFDVRTAQYRLNPTRNEKGQLKSRPNQDVEYNSKRDDAESGVKNYKGDNTAARNIKGLTEANDARRAEVQAQKNKAHNNKGQFISKKEKARNAQNARAKERYDIKRAFGMSVG